MKNAGITEFVKFKTQETTTAEQLIVKADILNEFQVKLDGYISAELVKGLQENNWCLIYRYETMEKVKVIGEKLRSSSVFGEFMSLIVPGSLEVTFYNQFKEW